MTSKLPRINLNFPILREAAKLYTPEVFELFQAEFELSGSAHIKCLEGNTYTVFMCDIDNETPHKSGQVVWTREDQTVSCSCKKFEREGILCWHALKVLNCEDIKVIPPRYVLNHWTKEAKDVTDMDVAERRVTEDSSLDVRKCYADLVRSVKSLCDMAQNEEEAQYVIWPNMDVEERRVAEDSPLDVRKRYVDVVRAVTSICDMPKNKEQAQFVQHKLLAFCRECKEKYQKLPRTSGEGNSTSKHSLQDRHSKRNPPIEKLPRAKKGKNEPRKAKIRVSQISRFIKAGY